MKIAIIGLALVASAAMSTATLADSAPSNEQDMSHSSSPGNSADRCSLLQKQYDDVEGEHLTDPSFETASGLHSEGVSACEADRSAVGVEKLEQALREIGIKPVE